MNQDPINGCVYIFSTSNWVYQCSIVFDTISERDLDRWQVFNGLKKTDNVYNLIRSKLAYLDHLELDVSFNLNELRSKLPSGIRINFVEHVGVADGFVSLKTVLTLGKLADDATSSKEYSEYMHGFLVQVDLSKVC